MKTFFLQKGPDGASRSRVGAVGRARAFALAFALTTLGVSPRAYAQEDSGDGGPDLQLPTGVPPRMPSGVPRPFSPAPPASERTGGPTGTDDGMGPSGPGGPSTPPTSSSSSSSGSSSSRPTSVSGDEEDDEDLSASSLGRQKPPAVAQATMVTIDFVDTPLTDLIKYMAEITQRNFILTDDLKGEVTIISHQPVSVAAAYEAFLSALEMAGYTTVTTGSATRVVPLGDAASRPIRVYEGGDIPYTDNYVTQIFQLENVSVTDMEKVVGQLKGKSAQVISYVPTNTLIITDAATNIRKIYKIISQLDVASPKSRLEIIPLAYAQASDIQTIIDQLYGKADTSSSTSASDRSSRSRSTSSSSRRRRTEPETETGSSTSVGDEGKYIEKVIADERTNSLLVLANEEALIAIRELIAQLDVDTDPTKGAQIHVIYLEHAKSEDVATVLANLSESGTSSSSSSSPRSAASRSRAASTRGTPGGPPPGAEESSGESSSGSAVAAFDSGVRITSDENTNSLVIIATRDQFAIIKQVIEKLDIRRKEVFVECVILEMASEDTSDIGIGIHAGKPTDAGGLSIGSAQLNGSSLGLSSDILSGMAMGVFGAPVEVSLPDFSSGSSTTLEVPAFGIALNALQSNSTVEILSTPNILTLDNEEAKIVVGRNIPFPVGTSYSSNSNFGPIVNYQREDVAITLKVTPQINESNYVTLEVFQEVTEVEEDSEGLSSDGGPITSKRSAETTVMVRDNQTVVIGGLIGSTETEVETKVPVLGDLPLVGNLFRGSAHTSRKTNLLIFLTPHVISEPADLEEVYRIKVAQRAEFVRRFYGKSRDEQEAEMQSLLRYSMNQIDEPSPWRTKVDSGQSVSVIGADGTTTTTTTATTTTTPDEPVEAAPVEDPFDFGDVEE